MRQPCGACRPIHSGIVQSAPAGGGFHREGSFTASDSAHDHKVDLELGHDMGMGERGGPAGTSGRPGTSGMMQPGTRHGMVLPFQPVTLTFRNIHYSVDLPAVSKPMTQPDNKIIISGHTCWFNP